MTTPPSGREGSELLGENTGDPVTHRQQNPRFWRRFAGQPVGVIAAVFLLLLVLACFCASVIAPYKAAASDFVHANQGPTSRHLLGTDNLGRDILSRLLFGGAHTLTAVAAALVVVILIGVPLGIAAGYLGGWWDRVISSLCDGLLALPAMILLLAVLAVFPHNTVAAMLAFGVIFSAGVARIVRAVVLTVRHDQYIDAARVSGLTELTIVRRHVLSKVWGPIVVQLTLLAAVAVLTESGLGYLGLGPQPPTPTWGSLVSDASSVIQQHPWLLVPTGGTIALTVLALSLFGDALRDALAVREPTRQRRTVAPNLDSRHLAEDSDLIDDAAGLLQVRNLSIAFGGGSSRQTVVRNVSFAVRAGETVALVGESGCGKTVTSRALMGLLSDGGAIVGGSVLLAGEVIASEQSHRVDALRGRRIAMISQEPSAALDPTLRVDRLLSDSVRRHTGRRRAAARRRAEELLAMVGIPDPADVMRRYPHELSGGMAQRVAIARALSGDPEVLIADEPTTALDVTVQAEILSLLRRLKSDTGLAILFVTHDWGVVADIADRCVVMYAGEIVETADVYDLFAVALHPYTRGLLESSPHLTVPGRRLHALPGRVPSPAEWPPGCHFYSRCPLAIDECARGPVPFVVPAPGRSSRCIRVDNLTGAPTHVRGI